MHILRIAAVAVAIGAAVVLTGIDAAQAKGHDNGVADGSPSGNPSVGGQTAGQGGNAVSNGQRGGQRGESASSLGRDNNGGKGNSGNARGGGSER